MATQNLYSLIIEKVFFAHYKPGMKEVEFQRDDIAKFAKKLKVDLPKNLGDLVYSFRYRTELPETIRACAGKGEIWIIRPVGRAKYCFVCVRNVPLVPNVNLVATKVPDATPGIVGRYAFSDEQALLARVRYNRLVDVFLGIVCYSLQSHLRTSVPGMGQVETDEIYVGVDKRGAQYIVPVQAKGGSDRLSVVQIEQDMGVCEHKFPLLVCRPVAAQFMEGGVIALFEFQSTENGVGIVAEKHYMLVSPEEISETDLKGYQMRE
jgi:hypothetical protein